MQDLELLHRFVGEQSQEAFRELVRRHTDWLYSVCLRRLRDPSLAEDATQAVFLALARKAPTLLHQPTLSPWLHQAAKFACANLQRAQKRRARHEMEAAAMTPVTTEWPRIEPDLEPALDRLPERDRQTILLRFYEQRSHAQIAATLQISEAAAHKRLERALDRLRSLLLTRGHHDLSAAALAPLLLSHAVAPAPASLTAALATASTATIPAHLVPATNGILHAISWLKLQFWGTVAAVTASTLVLGGTGLVLFRHALAATPAAASTPAAPALVPVSAPAATTPSNGFVMKLPNADFVFDKNPNTDEYQIDTDSTVKRTPSSDPSNHIKALVDAVLQPTVPAKRTVLIPALLFHGKRIHLTAWVKSADVQNWAGLQLIVLDSSGGIFSFSDMCSRPIHGTTDWQQFELVNDVPKDATVILAATAIYGIGEVWSDDFQISAVDPSTPTTDDQNWLKWSFYSPYYAAVVDPNESHDGHPAIRLSYVGPNPVPKDAWGQYNHQIRDIQQYLGHRIRLSVYVKTEKAGYCGPHINSRNSSGMTITHDSGYMHRTLKGTNDWALYSVECDIPKNATSIDSGVVLNGRGKVWIDVDSVQCEIVDGEKRP